MNSHSAPVLFEKATQADALANTSDKNIQTDAPKATSMQICFGCLHTFPETALTGLPFGKGLAKSFESLRATIAKLQPSNSSGRHCVANIEEELRLIVREIKQEIDSKDEKIEMLAAQVKFFSDREERERQREAEENDMKKQAVLAKPPPRRKKVLPYASGLLERFLTVSQMSTSPRTAAGGEPPPPRPPTMPLIQNRFGDTVSGGIYGSASRLSSTLRSNGGAGSGGVLGNNAKCIELISATLYNLVEAATVKVQANVGILFLRSDKEDELVAPIIVGRDHENRTTAPHRVSVTTSTPGTVLATGICVNLRSTRNNVEELSRNETLPQMLHSTVNSALYVPVFERYGAVTRDVLGVLALIASPTGMPFNRADESTCVGVSTMLSHVVSTYRSLLSEWSTRTFDHHPMTRNASYFADMDQRASTKGHTFFDELAALKTDLLVFRCDLQDIMNGGDSFSRIQAKGVPKQDVIEGATVTEICDTVKEAHRYTRTLETSWRNAVNRQIDLEKRVEELQKNVDSYRSELSSNRYSMDKIPSVASIERQGGTSDNSAQPKKSQQPITATELDEIETEATKQHSLYGGSGGGKRGGGGSISGGGSSPFRRASAAAAAGGLSGRRRRDSSHGGPSATFITDIKEGSMSGSRETSARKSRRM